MGILKGIDRISGTVANLLSGQSIKQETSTVPVKRKHIRPPEAERRGDIFSEDGKYNLSAIDRQLAVPPTTGEKIFNLVESIIFSTKNIDEDPYVIKLRARKGKSPLMSDKKLENLLKTNLDKGLDVIEDEMRKGWY